ncbi:hypothetical protein B9G69_005990 [Bdellovibrio sp. SKB1291214]|uniref:hypothetical protein n=1 Tax=Bdellovibrio sp. SKB1291214 TaxID=1732569 RepID=UPI000B51E594|nr:hypothetical protein [Bdellovibrio sp. SKB1291214]UYL10128.1 hypothetical protein B9G69_005990 [Bdellovibrio sp. SKB1291214]
MRITMVAVLLMASAALAQLPDTSKMMDQAKGKASDIMAACKEDKIKFCDKVTEMNAIKECLKRNKDGLSAGCKSTLGVK